MKLHKSILVCIIILIASIYNGYAKDKYIYYADEDFPPYEFLRNDEIVGFNIDLMKQIAAAMNFDIEFRSGEWAKVIREFDSGSGDILAMYYTAHRELNFDFTMPFITSSLKVFYNTKTTHIPLKINELFGAKAVLQKDCYTDEYVTKNYSQIQITRVKSPIEALKLTLEGKYKYAVVPSLIGEHFLEYMKHDRRLKASDIDFGRSPYAFAVREGNYELQTLINEGLQKIRANGEFQTAYNDWFATQHVPTENVLKQYWVYGLYILIPALVLFSIIVIWNNELKRQVKNKTAELERELEERRKTEEQLKLFQFALDNSAESVYGLNEDAGIIYANTAAINTFGYPEEELLGKRLPELVDERMDEKKWARNVQNLKENNFATFEVRHKTKYGDYIPLEGSLSLLRAGGGDYIFAIMRDITERKTYESALRESEEQFKSMFQKHNIIMLLADWESFNIIEINESAVEFYGYCREEFLNLSLMDLYRLNLYSMRELRDKQPTNGKAATQAMHWLKNGSAREVEISSTFIQLSSRKLLFAIISDVTEKNHALRRLKESEEKFSKAFMTSPDAFLLIRMSDNVIVEVNQGFEESAEYSHREAIGKTTEELDLWADPQDRYSVLKELEEKGQCVGYDLTFKTKSGTPIYALLSAKVIEIGGELFILAILREITLRKMLEESLVKERERLDVTLRSIGDGVITTDSDGLVTMLNPVAQELTGWDEISALGKSIEDIFNIIDETTGRKIKNPIRTSLRSNEVSQLANHTVLVAKDGSKRIISDSAAPIRLSQSDLVGAVLVFRDITKIKETEAALKRERDFVSTMIQTVGSMIFIMDKNCIIQSINRKFSEISGWSEEEIKGKSFIDLLIPKAYRKRIASEYFNLASGGAVRRSGYGYWVMKDGSLKYISWSNSVVSTDDSQDKFIIGTGIDITELKDAENKMTEMARDYEVIVEASGQVVFTYDVMNDYIEWGGSLHKVFGYSTEEMHTNFNSILLKLHPEDQERVRSEIQQCLEKGIKLYTDYRFLAKDGKYIWVHQSATAIIDEGGAIKRMLGVIQNIDERIKSESNKNSLLKISDAANRSLTLETLCKNIHKIISELMPASNFYLTLFDEETDELSYPYFVDEFDSNPGVCKAGKGLTEYVLRTGKTQLIDPEEFYKLVLEGEVESIGAPSIDWLGAPLHYKGKTIGAVVVQTYKEGVRYTQEHKNILGFVSNQIAVAIEEKRSSDALMQSYEELEARVEERTSQLKAANEEMQMQIFERMRIEKEIRESEERFRVLADSAPVMIWMTDELGSMAYVNKTWLEFVDGKFEDEIGAGWQKHVVTEDVNRIAYEMKRLVADPQDFRMDFRMKRFDGEIKLFFVHGAPRYLPDGTFIGYIGTCFDITDLANALEREKELNFLKTRFISTVSHEYRTPLTTIMTSTYLVEKFIEAGDTSEVAKYLQRIQNSVHNMTSLLEQVITISKADSGKLKINYSKINLQEFTENLLEEVKLFDKEDHKFDYTINTEKLSIESDVNLLHQILINLMTNAVKYSPRETLVCLNVMQNENGLEIKITDRGQGIPKDQVEYLFQPFFRANNVGAIQGTGLGLSIVKRCVDALEGDIKVESQLGEGTLCVVNLPLRDVKSRLVD
ncbi:MAG: PAS domain S-box protein [Chloroflexota bacterium]